MGSLILHNLKKAKGQFLSFAIVMLITAVILNTALVLLFQTGDAYDSLFDELNTSDFSVTVPSLLSSDELLNEISEIDGVSEKNTHEALFASAALQDFQDSEFTMNTYFYRIGDERELTKHTVAEQTETADEIAIGNAFASDYEIGDTFTLTQSGSKYAYTVTGYIQSVNNNGFIAEITDEGYANLSDVPLYSLNLYMDENAGIPSFVDKLEHDYDEYTVSVSNTSKETESMQRMYSSLIAIVAASLFIITVLIILLILYVILRSMLTSLKTDFGIYKALGFTSRQLIMQTVGSITPVVLLGSFLSSALGVVYLPAMFDGIFGVIGAIKNNFEIPLYMLLIMAVILTVVNVMIGVILCRPIKRITAYSLIKE